MNLYEIICYEGTSTLPIRVAIWARSYKHAVEQLRRCLPMAGIAWSVG